MAAVEYFTEKGLEKFLAELNQLKTVDRPSITKQIAEARDKGDLSENAEYHAAKEAQGMLEAKIAKLEQTASTARVLDESNLDTSKVVILTTVKIKKEGNSAEMKYTLVAESESDIKAGKISVDSPMGKGLLGKKKGEVAVINVPNGKMKFKILEISR